MRTTTRTPARLLAFVPALALVLVAGVARAEPVWQEADTLSGLVGSYSRASTTPGPISYVTLGGTDGYHAQGPYTRFFDVKGILTLQKGNYRAIANNPAVGAIIVFEDEHGLDREAWFIVGVRRDPLGRRITAMKLQPSEGDGASIILYRVGL
ncbi:MAG: hypothetical protein JWN44_1041 [Myxococcales bacterium]|nr:hypothetical protein [Myxococcales bacterium]